MCLSDCANVVRNTLSRRQLLAGLAFGVGATQLSAEPLENDERGQPRQYPAFSRIVDLTHPLTPEFPTFSGRQQFSMKALTTRKDDGYSSFTLNLQEHTGTHIDAPIHFAEHGLTVGDINATKLVAPMCVIDVRERARRDADARVTVDDIRSWEMKHGPVPKDAAVAMNSGWDRHVGSRMFRNADDEGALHFPGFHEEAAAYLVEERRAGSLIVDTLSLDYGRSTTFPVHTTWLPSNRWGVECAANLSALPASGATLVAACPRIPGATGIPLRLMALVSS